MVVLPERRATLQTARKGASRTGFDALARATLLRALRMRYGHSTRHASRIRANASETRLMRSSEIGSKIMSALLLCLFAGHSQSEECVNDEFAAVAEVIRACEVCHGKYGVSIQQQYPILAGQEFYYLYVQLKDFKSGLREDPIMGPLASALEKEQMQLVAMYFSEQPWPDMEYASDDQATRSALAVITAGQCVACHLGAFHGNSRVPRLAGQHPEYLAKTMVDFKSKSRKNSPAKGSLMGSFETQELVDVAQHLSSL